ncbi:MAG: 30S ribosomal protein S3, partial [Candidatus Bathyarchaeia archaeon]
RTDRARYEKFRLGYLPKSGDPALKYIRKAALQVQLKPGIFGVKVHIMPPNVEFPDKISIIEESPERKEKSTAEAETKVEGEAKGEAEE